MAAESRRDAFPESHATRRAVLAMSLATAVFGVGGIAAAATDGGVHAIVNVDLLPDRQGQGASLLVDFVRKARHDPSVRSIVLVQQANASNHYIIDLFFADHAAYRRFVQEAFVRDFRAALFPNLGSPWDERLGSDVAV